MLNVFVVSSATCDCNILVKIIISKTCSIFSRPIYVLLVIIVLIVFYVLYFLICYCILCIHMDVSSEINLSLHCCRPGQDWVPAEPRESGHIPESLRHHWALLWLGRGGQPDSTEDRREHTTVSVQCRWRGALWWLPVLTHEPRRRASSASEVAVQWSLATAALYSPSPCWAIAARGSVSCPPTSPWNSDISAARHRFSAHAYDIRAWLFC